MWKVLGDDEIKWILGLFNWITLGEKNVGYSEERLSAVYFRKQERCTGVWEDVGGGVQR